MLQKKYSSKNSLAANFQKNGVHTLPCAPQNYQVTGVFFSCCTPAMDRRVQRFGWGDEAVLCRKECRGKRKTEIDALPSYHTIPYLVGVSLIWIIALWSPDREADFLANNACSLNWQNPLREHQEWERGEQEAEEEGEEAVGGGPEGAVQVAQQELEAVQLARDVEDILHDS